MNETATRHTQRGRTETEFAQPGLPVLSGPEGILYDFNYGCRVQVPVDGWHVRMTDLDTFNVLLDEAVEANAVITSRRKYFVRFLLEVFDGQRLVFSHAFDATNKKVRCACNRWRWAIRSHGCRSSMHSANNINARSTCRWASICSRFIATVIRICTSRQRPNWIARTDTYYATYYVGLLKPFSERDHQPTDPRVSNMQDMIAYLLGVPCEERRPNVVIADKTRTIAERYVCIATQSTAQCKYWNNPRGWPTLIEHLKTLGYRVLCIDRDKQYGNARIHEHDAGRRRGFHRQPAIAGTREPVASRGFFYRIGKRAVVARMGGRHARGHDQRLLASIDRVPHAVSRDQFSRLQ